MKTYGPNFDVRIPNLEYTEDDGNGNECIVYLLIIILSASLFFRFL